MIIMYRILMIIMYKNNDNNGNNVQKTNNRVPIYKYFLIYNGRNCWI